MAKAKLKDVYRDLGKKDLREIMELIGISMGEIVPMLDDYDDEMVITVAEYYFMMIAVDEKVHMNEYRLIKPLMKAAFGKNCSYAETEKFISENGFDEEETRERFRDVLDGLKKTDPELRYRMIMLAMYIAAVDEDISKRERTFIESLL